MDPTLDRLASLQPHHDLHHVRPLCRVRRLNAQMLAGLVPVSNAVDARMTARTRFRSRAYLYALLAVLGVVVLSNVAVLLRGPGVAYGLATALPVLALVLVLIRHRWARLAVQAWAGFALLGGVLGAFMLQSVSASGGQVAWWGYLSFAVFVIAGLFFLVTAHRFIEVERVPAQTSSS